MPLVATASAPDPAHRLTADAAPSADPPPEDGLGRWVAAARAATDPCLVVDVEGRIAGMSAAAAALLSGGDDTAGRRLLDEVLVLVDFSDGSRPAPAAARRIPPVVAVQENQLSRGVLRVRGADGRPLMLDAVATPLHDEAHRVVGALSFFATV